MSRPDGPPATADVTGVVLAGGRARRMQARDGDPADVDKGLLVLAGRTLVAHVLDRFAPQVGRLFVSANRNLDAYRASGHPVLPDPVGGFPGPLAGWLAAMDAATSDWIASAPCDAPLLPADLVAELLAAAVAAGAPAAFARCGTSADRSDHPVFAVIRRDRSAALRAYLDGGGRRVGEWLARIGAVPALFPEPRAFTNVNTPDELAMLDALLAARTTTLRHGATDDADLPVDEARARMLAQVRPVAGTETRALEHCLDRILAQDLVCPIDVPPHDNAAMDGFAFAFDAAAGATGRRLRVVGKALAGRPFDGRVGPGEAVRIMTGAVMPEGADTVVMQEAARLDDDHVVLPPALQPGQNRRRRGEDLARGSVALSAGRRLGPAELGLAASLGFDRLPLRRPLRVAYFSTGDEVLAPGQAPEPGRIFDSNRYTILGLLGRLGATTIDLGVVRDDPVALQSRLDAGLAQADAIISSGGVSVGEADFTRRILQHACGAAFWSIAMRPGRPMAFGCLGERCYFGLPGNPVAAMTSFLVLVQPVLLRLMGAVDVPLPAVRARAVAAIRKRPGRTDYLRATLARDADGSWQVRALGNQGSGVLRSMSEADCLIVLEPDRGDVAAGDAIDVLPLRPFC